MWSSVGMQGALLVDLGLEPVRISSIVIGDVHGHEKFYGDLELIRQDCRRAFGERLQGVALPDAYEVRIPEIHWTPRRFNGSKRRPTEERPSSNECKASGSHGGDLSNDLQRYSGQQSPTSTKFWRMAFDAVQVQRIAIWNTSGARHVACGVFFGILTVPACNYVDLLRARRPSSCCTTRSQQLTLVHLCTSSPLLFAKSTS